MGETSYPNEREIRKALLLPRLRLVSGTLLILVVGLALELNNFLPLGFARAGGVATVFVLWYYYRLESKEFLTGNPGNYIESDNHYLPKAVLAAPYTACLLLGTAVWIFGDLVAPLRTCGRLTC